jgi:hypothetical protein
MKEIILVLIISLFFIIIVGNSNRFENLENSAVPKIIWSFWDNSDNVPEFIKIAQKNWKKFSPQYKINFVTNKNIREYIDLPPIWNDLEPVKQSDLFRLIAIEKYGGVWMDASILLLTDLDNFIKPDGLTFFLTPSTDRFNPVYESWFISAPPKNNIIKKWLDEFIIAVKDRNKYVNDSPKENVKAVGNAEYLLPHIALKNIYEKNKNDFKDVKAINVNNTAFFEHNKYKWKDIGKKVFENDFQINPDRLMIKFRGDDRTSIQVNKIPKELYV